VRWERLSGWLAETPAELAVASAARFVGLVLAWWLLASTVLYLVASLGRLGRLARGLRFATLPGVRHLVDAGLAMAITTSAVGGSALAAGASPQPVAVVVAAPGVAPDALRIVTTSAPVAAAQLGESVAVPAAAGFESEVPEAGGWYKVARGDSLWEIAKHQLGEGERYPEIWALNARRTMNDGRTFRNPSRIRPGWVLALPPGVAQQPAAPPAAAEAPQPPIERQATPPVTSEHTEVAAPEAAAGADTVSEAPDAGESSASQPTPTPTPAPAEAPDATVAPPAAKVWPPPSTAEAPRPPVGPRPVPAETPAPTPAAERTRTTIWPAPVSTPTEPAAEAGETATSPTMSASKGGRTSNAPLGVGVGAAGLAGAAVVGLLLRRRLGQLTRRRPGRRLPLPDGDDARIEVAMQAGADPDGAVLLADALAAVAITVDVDGEGLPEILGAHLTDGRIELLLASAAPTVPEPFTASDDGLRWGAASADVLEPVDRPSNPAPAMVTLGRTSEGTLLVNLETIGLLALEGDRERAVGTLRRMAFELGAPFLAGILHLIVVGLPEVTGLDKHVERASSLGAALDRAAWLVGDREEQLAIHGAGTADVARAAGLNSDTWAPVVVLAAGPVTEEELQQAAAATADSARAGMAVVVAGEHSTARWALDLDEDLVDVGPLGLSIEAGAACETRVLSYGREDAEAVSAVLATALLDDDVSRHEPPYDTVDDEGWGWPTLAEEDSGGRPDEPASEEKESTEGHLHVVKVHDPEPTFEVWIRVLGPIEVDGKGFDRGKSRELAVALALRRPGLTTAQLDELLWPGGGKVVGSTRNSTVSAARAGLRRTEKENLIPYGPVDGGEFRYRLDLRVGTDWNLFRWLARQTGPGEADRLTRALDLVRGEPLGAPPSGFVWAQEAIWEMRQAVADVAHRLAQLRLETLDLPRATRAARAGLLAEPWDQWLYADLMQAAEAAGNPAGVEAAYSELTRRLETLDNDDKPHPDIDAIYRRCRNRQHRA